MAGEALAVTMSADECPPAAAERVGLLFDAHHQRLYRLARRLSRSAEDARDLVQETYLRAAQSVRSIPAGAQHEEAWLVRVLINICRDGWRRTAVRRRLEPLRLADTLVQSGHLEQTFIAQTTIWRALERLPPRRRAAVVLYELEGKTIPAIATLLGVTAVTVRWHLSRGRKDLARIIGQVGQEGRERQERQDGQEGQEGQDGQACAPKLGDTGERRRDG
jgi:RNA polymerase sigma-70 factor, ECF subfamily